MMQRYKTPAYGILKLFKIGVTGQRYGSLFFRVKVRSLHHYYSYKFIVLVIYTHENIQSLWKFARKVSWLLIVSQFSAVCRFI